MSNYADVSKLSDDLKAAGGNSEKAMQHFLRASAEDIFMQATSIVPVLTGNLRSSIKITESSMSITVGPDKAIASYADYIEYGTGTKGEFPTKAYEIKAKPGKVLAFRVNGQLVYRKKVIHPGIKAQPYMRPAFQEWLESLGERASQVGVNLIMGQGPEEAARGT